MRYALINLRIGGWSGIIKSIDPALDSLGEIEEELLPVKIYMCKNCGKLEFVASEKAKRVLERKMIENVK
jgi:hypothetical protein